MATFFTVAMNKDAMNYILIGIMSIVPLFLIIKYPYLKKSEFIIYILFCSMTLSSMMNSATFRISTIAYSLMYILTYIFYLRLIKKTPITIEVYEKIILFLFWAFFIVMLIQQFCALIDIPIFNYRVGDLSTFKVNSLASEPSYFAKIVLLLMLSYIGIREIRILRKYNLFSDIKNDALIWFLFFYQMLLCGSSFAIALMFIFIMKYIKISLKTVFIASFLSLFIGVIVLHSNPIVIERVVNILKASMTLNEAEIFESDQSGAFRIVPTILYVKQFDLFNIDMWFGCGVDYTKSLIPTLMPGIEENSFSVGLFPAFIWDFGIISTVLLFWFVFKFTIHKNNLLDVFIWAIIILDAPFNTQLFWITIILMSTNKFIQEKYHNNQMSKKAN